MPKAERILPLLRWARLYNRSMLVDDLLAAVTVTLMLIPQSLAYAMLAGLPPQMGLYASILPLIAYCLFGSSHTLAVGPVAVISLMTATAAAQIAEAGSAVNIEVAMALALLSGAMLALMGVLRFGFVADFMSHPVMTGFISASGVLIAASQLKHLLGISANGQSLVAIFDSLIRHLADTNTVTAIVGGGALALLYGLRRWSVAVLKALGVPARAALLLSRAAPILAVALTTVLVALFRLDQEGVAIVGHIPATLPDIRVPTLSKDVWLEILSAAALISLVGFVESISVAQTLAIRRRQSIDANQELMGLGAANLAASVSGGYPVTGGFARSAVNFEAGAQTPAAGALTAVGIAIAIALLVPFLYYLPQATLSATIIIAVLTLVNIRAFRQAWRYDKSDFTSMVVTATLTLLVGVKQGILCGIICTFGLYFARTSRPRCVEVGLLSGTREFQDVRGDKVGVLPTILTLRIDESLFFANARFLETQVMKAAANRCDLKHVILMCTSVNEIDGSALESLAAINDRLLDGGIRFHLSELKPQVLDRLGRSDFLTLLSGSVFNSQFSALQRLSAEKDDPAAAI
ncbi:MAG: sulfate permease [Pseudomonadota bacterium]